MEEGEETKHIGTIVINILRELWKNNAPLRQEWKALKAEHSKNKKELLEIKTKEAKRKIP